MLFACDLLSEPHYPDLAGSAASHD